VITEPPVDAGAVHDTPSEDVVALAADTAVGAPGAVAGAASATALDAGEAGEDPTAFVATTVAV
jgi:hypothetical protein